MLALLRTTWLTLVLGLTSTLALAASKPAVVYSAADKFDKSVNQEVYEGGVVRYLKETGVQVTERSPASEAERLSTLRELASAGYSPIVVSPIRSPHEVVASLVARNGLPPTLALRLWLGLSCTLLRGVLSFGKFLFFHNYICSVDFLPRIVSIASSLNAS